MTKPERRLKMRYFRRKPWEMWVGLLAFCVCLLATVYAIGWILIQIGILQRD